MLITRLLEENKSIILNRWFELTAKTYSEKMSHFLKRTKDQFANPVGATFRTSMETILDLLIKGANASGFHPVLEKIIKIRAVQEFNPSQAIGFIFLLKTAIREGIKPLGDKKNPVEIEDSKLLRELLEFELTIDGLCLVGFDLYMKSREKVYEIKATELRDRAKKFMERVDSSLIQDAQSPTNDKV